MRETLRRHRRAAWLCALLTLSGSTALPWPGVAQAQDRATIAKDLFDEGARLEDEGKFEEAGAKFQEAANLIETPQLRLRAGRCQERAGLLLEAEKNIQRGIELADTDEELRRVGEELATKLKGRIPTLVFQVEPTPHPPGFTVSLDGETVSVVEPLRVNPRAHKLSAAAKGYLTWRQEVTPKEGATEIVAIRMVVGDDTAVPEKPAAETTYGALPWVLLGAGGGVLAASIGLGVGNAVTKSAYLDAAPAAGCSVIDGDVQCPREFEANPPAAVVDLQAQGDLANGLLAGAIVLGVVAGGAIGGGIALAMLNEEVPPSVGIIPWFSPFDHGVGGASLVGAF